MTHGEAGRIGGLKIGAVVRTRSIAAYYADPSYCVKCLAVIKVRDGQSAYEAKIKKFCGLSCSTSYHNSKLKKVRMCVECKSQPASARSVFCGVACRSAYRCKGGPVSHEVARAHLIIVNGAKCQRCGWDKINPKTGKCPVVLNHIDGNSQNMAWDNLEIICPNCDSLTPTYKSLNRGKGRRSRMLRYRAGLAY